MQEARARRDPVRWTPSLSSGLWSVDGIGRSWEQAHDDGEWCAAIARFVS